MQNSEFSKYIIKKPRQYPQINNRKLPEENYDPETGLKSTHLLTVDDSIVKDFFFADCTWFWGLDREEKIEAPHYHEFDEVVGLIGSNIDDPYDLCGEISIWINGREQRLTQSCLIFIPAGTIHCPYRINKILKPVFFIKIAPVKRTSRIAEKNGPSFNNNENPASFTIITDPGQRTSPAKSPDGKLLNPELRSKRILHLEDDILRGSFYADFLWLYEGKGQAPAPSHSHEWPELIGMVGCDPTNPKDIGGEMSIVLGDEEHIINKNSLVCIPQGLKHCPWKFLEIRKPTLVFSAGPSSKYTESH